MKLITWNVNGLRAAIAKGLYQYILDQDPDVVCLQETKLNRSVLSPSFEGYHVLYNDAERNGYSGTAILTKEKPITAEYGSDKEGRMIAAEFSRFYVISAYAPNAGRGMERKREWNNGFYEKLTALDKKKPLMIAGDLNAAMTAKDVFSDSLEGTNGYTEEERSDMRRLLSAGFTDVYRYLFREGHEYTWWSYTGKAKEKDRGMRIDYWLLSDRIRSRVNSIRIDKAPGLSDHAPIILDIAY